MKIVIPVLLLVVVNVTSARAQNSQQSKPNSEKKNQGNGNGDNFAVMINYTMENSGIGQGPVRGVTPIDPTRIHFHAPGANAPNTLFKPTCSSEVLRPEDANVINAPVRQFALDLLTSLHAHKPNKSIVMSTFSVWSVLLVMLEGAAGATASQIRIALGLQGNQPQIRSNYCKLEEALKMSSKAIEFDNSNAIFFDHSRPLLSAFENVARSHYDCEVLPLDFRNADSVVQTVNHWVANATHNRIDKILRKNDVRNPQLIAANAIYFKAPWKNPFNVSATFSDKFYDEKGQYIGNVSMMYQKGEFLYSYVTQINAHILDMPYADGKFRMLVILPNLTTTIQQTLWAMKKFPIDACYDLLVREQEMFSDSFVHVYLPRFKVKSTLLLNPNLKALGIVDLFDSMKANLSLLSHGQLFLSRFVHAAEIDVNEEGTTASGASGGTFGNRGTPPKFVANRPFAYFIVEESQRTVLFAGKVYNPNSKSNE